ncbi:Bcr/CflA subfamily drug resistance transporter [Actibacterium atlanticum]|uniref:Bcr/CflA subfamily drug resistance transporter n=1 Tax=Actibacterium atlanticum TaxID=1461693 RepID=A0A058ZQ53_9RHOB|nr:multidrug effflux MFS transporter [Actibacterium atlanticum]KCV83704.1 Bcr/CflA subfamily drug resistance transporter [Actibacterium atlanticum]
MPFPARLKSGEFIAMTAMMFATIAFSVDAMLPALPEIGAELTPDALNKAQLIISSFILGMGMGTMITGPLSDAFGRRPVIFSGAALYIVASIVAAFADSLELMLIARVFQGFGAAAPRVVGLAIVRDLYEGRDMARITSFIMMIFTLLPALAPTLGAFVIALGSWRLIFGLFVVFSVVSITWFGTRQRETLLPERRRPLQLSLLVEAITEVFSHRIVTVSIFVQALIFGCLFMMLTSTQQVFDIYFDEGEHFHLWFGFIALMAGASSLLNAKLVGRLGMRVLIRFSLNVQVAVSAVMLVMYGLGLWPAWAAFPAFILWQITVFGMLGLTVGNLNALAMVPLGHIAGMAASVIGATATVLSLLIAVPVGLAFDGTPIPLGIGLLSAVAVARVLFFLMPREEA